MEIEVAIRTLILADATLAALVGASVAPAQVQQAESYPVIWYHQADAQRIRTLAGWLLSGRYLMHLEMEAEDYSTVKAILSQLKKPVPDGGPLVGYSGTVGSSPDTCAIQGIFEETSEDSALTPIWQGEDGIYRAGLDLKIIYGS